MQDWKGLFDEHFNGKLGGLALPQLYYCKLVSLNPLNFKPDNEDEQKIDIKEEFLVVPKYRPFTEKDLNKKFVLLSNNGGQTYFYLYEASEPQGSNGIAYDFEGSHSFVNGNITCTLKGTTSDGKDVTITSGSIQKYIGTIEKITHKNHINKGGEI